MLAIDPQLKHRLLAMVAQGMLLFLLLITCGCMMLIKVNSESRVSQLQEHIAHPETAIWNQPENGYDF